MLRIIRIPVLPFGMVNAHLIIGPHGCILVDAGLPGTEKKLQTVLHRNGLEFRDIRLIVITHAHVDHAGNAAKIRSLSGAPILAHEGDLPYYLREREMHFCASGLFGRLFLRTGLMYEAYEPFHPDILLQDDDSRSLNEWGFNGLVRHTPGHTAGSITVQLEGQYMLVGDLLASGLLLGGIAFTGHAKSPPFEDDPRRVGEELQALIASGGTAFYIGHGGPLSAEQVAKHAARLLKKQP